MMNTKEVICWQCKAPNQVEDSAPELLEALNRLRLAEKDCRALRNWDQGFEDYADVAELKEAQAEADEAISKAKGGR